MRLTRKKAIKLCIELWTWLAETGQDKREWLEWEKYGDIDNDCWFCEYGTQQMARYTNSHSCKDECDYCPLSILYKKDGCYDEKCGYCRWENAKTPRTRKKYAKLFLAQIKKCK